MLTQHTILPRWFLTCNALHNRIFANEERCEVRPYLFTALHMHLAAEEAPPARNVSDSRVDVRVRKGTVQYTADQVMRYHSSDTEAAERSVLLNFTQ